MAKQLLKDLMNKPAVETVEEVLTPLDGGKSKLTGEAEVRVKVPKEGTTATDPTEDDERPSRGTHNFKKREKASVVKADDKALAEAMAEPLDDEELTIDPSTVVERCAKIRDRILRIKGNRPYWDTKLSYNQRQVLNGALLTCQELLQDLDDSKIQLSLERYLGIQLPAK